MRNSCEFEIKRLRLQQLQVTLDLVSASYSEVLENQNN